MDEKKEQTYRASCASCRAVLRKQSLKSFEPYSRSAPGHKKGEREYSLGQHGPPWFSFFFNETQRGPHAPKRESGFNTGTKRELEKLDHKS